jgi:CubicO group peptidase (beta-lactamase class C family)
MEDGGIDPVGLERALKLVSERGAVAQLCLLRDGAVVLDHTVGCGPRDLFLIFSASKPFVAMAVHLLAQRGALSLDDAVAAHWPAFGRQGKDSITIRQVLQHRAGVPVARSLVADGAAMTSWERSVRAVERARPVPDDHTGPTYHILSFGFILGELVRRVTGVPVQRFLASEILEPLGLHDTYLGVPGGQLHRAVPVRATGRNARLKEFVFNRRATRRAVIPAAGLSSTARDLARFYQALLDVGTPRSAGLFTPGTLAQACEPSNEDEVDRFLGVRVRWAHGFQLGGPDHRSDAAVGRAMGRHSSALTFGHNGSNCCIGWADPTRRLAFAYTTNLLPAGGGRRHQRDVADAILTACD